MFVTLCLGSSRVEVSRRFYDRLGIDFLPEQHGDRGLRHFAAVIPDVPVEIYPTVKSLPPGERSILWR